MKRKVVKSLAIGMSGVLATSSMSIVNASETEFPQETALTEGSYIANERSSFVGSSVEEEAVRKNLSPTEKVNNQETESELASETAISTETEKAIEGVTESETEKITESETSSEVQTESETQSETQTESESETEPESETESESETETESETNKPVVVTKDDIYSLFEIVNTDTAKSNMYIDGKDCYYTKMYVSALLACKSDDGKVVRVSLKTDKGIIDSEYKENAIVFEVPNGITTATFSVDVLESDGDTATFEYSIFDEVEELKNVKRLNYVDPEKTGANYALYATLLKSEKDKAYVDSTTEMTIRNISSNVEVPLVSYRVLILNEEGKEEELKVKENKGTYSFFLPSNRVVTSESIIFEMKDVLGRVLVFKPALNFNGVNTEVYKEFYCVEKENLKLSGEVLSNSLSTIGKEGSYSKTPVDFAVGYNTFSTSRLLLVTPNGEEKDILSTKGKFTVSESGTYKIKVENILGKSKTYSMSEVFKGINNNIIIDKEASAIVATVNGKPIVTDFYKDTAILNVNVEDNTGIRSVLVNVNGDTYLSDDEVFGKKYSSDIDLSKPSKGNGVNTIEVSVSDYAGNLLKASYTVNLDMSAPTLKGSTESTIYDRDDGIYCSKDGIKVNLKAEDVESGIEKVEVFKNGSLVQEDVKDTFLISESGTYLFKVYDNVGHTYEVDLKDLLGLKSNQVVLDADKPVIERNYGFDLGSTINDVLWYTSLNDFVYVVKDENYDSIKCTVNGRDINVNLGEKNAVEIKKDDLSFVKDGKVKIELSVVDKANNITTDVFEYSLDREAPVEIEASTKSECEVYNGVAYYKKNPSITFSAKDMTSKVLNYTVGNKVSTDGNMVLSPEDGTSLVVSDVVGNKTAPIDIMKLLDINATRIVVDGSSPIIKQVSGFNPDLEYDSKKWYSSKPTLIYSISDENLRSVTITVNDKVEVSGRVNSGDFKVDLSNVDDGKVSVEVEARDLAGNIEKSSFTFYLDRKAPSGLSGRVDKKYEVRDTGIFFKNAPNIILSSDDSGVGVSKYYMNDKAMQGASARLDNGTYSFKVEDRLKNTSKVVSLGTMLGIDKEKVVIDGESPLIDCHRPEGGENGWFKEDKSFSARVSDNIGVQEATISINGTVVDRFKSNGEDVKSVALSGNTSKVTRKNDGSYDIVVSVEDKAGNTKEWTDTIYVDKEAPKVTRFVFNGTSISNGAYINGTGKYGFFFTGKGSVLVKVDDGEISSGVSEVVMSFDNRAGESFTKRATVSGGEATFTIPNNFRGYISAYAVDKVGNKGDSEKPDGVVSESSNWHSNSVDMNILLPESNGTDDKGNPLYSENVSVRFLLGCDLSGIKNVSWGIGNKTLGRASVDANGNLSGDAVVEKSDNNLVLSLRSTLSVTSNEDAQTIWVKLTDRLGNVSEDSKTISIDKDAPIISVTLSEQVEKGGYYKTGRTAKIRVSDRNIDVSDIKILGESGELSGWVRQGEAWVTTMSMEKDGVYDWSLTAADKAGNKGITYTLDSFTVDSENPVMKVSFDNDESVNEKYFKKGRKATITVDDKNFDEKSVSYLGDGELGTWVKVGSIYRNTVIFDEDGKYSFSVSCKDKAGNVSNMVKVDEFIVDTEKPKIEVKGIEDGVSYKKNINFSIKVSDDNLDVEKLRVSLIGRKNGAILLDGSYDSKKGEYKFDGFEDDKKFDDVYTVKVYAADMATNFISDEYTFTVNRYGSQYSADDEIGIFGNYLREAKDVVLHEVNVSRLDIKKCKIVIVKDGKTIDLSEDVMSISEEETKNGWEYTYKVNKEVFKEDGVYQIQVYSVSDDGTDYSNVSQEYSFVLDTEKPEIVISGVEAGEKYHEYSKRITVEVRDLSGVESIVLKVNGEEVKHSIEDGLYVYDIVESPEVQSISVEVTDKAGNSATSGVSGFLITSNMFVFISNQPWFKYSIGVVIGLLAVLIALITRRQIVSRRKERETLERQKELYTKSDGSSDKDEE